MVLPVLDLKLSQDPRQRGLLLEQLRDALFNIGFLYIKNHGVPNETIDALADRVSPIFNLSDDRKLRLSKLNSPNFLGYSRFAEEETGENVT